MNKKNFRLKTACAVILAGSALLCSCSPGTDDVADGYIAAEPDGKDYSFNYPNNWTELRSDSMYAIEAPDGNANISAASFGISNDVATIDEYVEGDEDTKGYTALLHESFGEMVEITSTEKTTLGGREAMKIEYNVKVGEDHYYFTTILSLLPTSFDTLYLYDLTYTAFGEEVYSTHSAVFNGIAETFTFN